MIDDITNVDKRRHELKLPSLAEYAKLIEDACANPSIAIHSAFDPKLTVPIPPNKAPANPEVEVRHLMPSLGKH